MLYQSHFKSKLHKYKMNPKYPSPAQIRHDQYHTFWCVLCASAIEILTVHLYAKGTFTGGTQLFFGAAVAANCGWVALTTYWRLTHFWFTHRMMHPWKTTVIPDLGKVLYKHVHSLHHKSYNASTWAGLSMHPVEGTIYFTAAMIPAVFGAHPFCFLLCKLCLAIDSCAMTSTSFLTHITSLASPSAVAVAAVLPGLHRYLVLTGGDCDCAVTVV